MTSRQPPDETSIAQRLAALKPATPRELAQRILDLESRHAVGGARFDAEWTALILQLWRTLARESTDGGPVFPAPGPLAPVARKNARLPAQQHVALDVDGVVIDADLADVSHAGLQLHTKDAHRAALAPGVRALWRSAQTANAAYALDLPCVVIWARAVDGGATSVGLSFDDADRGRWGEAFFTWYARVYRDFLWSLVRG